MILQISNYKHYHLVKNTTAYFALMVPPFLVDEEKGQQNKKNPSYQYE
jgi:hypothetical protein